MLLRAGYAVRVCASAGEALAALAADASGYDVVVTDHNMPDGSGLDIARRAAELAPLLPVVLSSGLTDDALRAQAAAAGVRVVLPKEAGFERLVATVAAVLAGGPEAGS
ncbi:MAG: response regulator [Comamonadaceae bacterium]|nr:response regulator [Comamonadaceae bacterium]